MVNRTITDLPGSDRRGRKGNQPRLRVVDSPSQALIDLTVPLTGALVFGRAPGRGGVPISDPRISGVHAVVSLDKDGTIDLRDERSKNGTFVNGIRVNVCQLKFGDVIRIGSTLMVVSRSTAEQRVESPDDHLIGDGPVFRETVASVIKGAGSSIPMLLLGETGSGKEVMAQLTHRKSDRNGPFMAVNCAAIPNELIDSTLFGHKKGAFTGAQGNHAGFFREADTGTLFLDEIGDLPLPAQAKLLRALELGEIIPLGHSKPIHVDVRVVAATNVDLEQAVQNGQFRADLFARLSGWTVHLPPLRERKEDILGMARHFLGAPHPGTTRDASSWEADVAETLLIHNWPYNVRELKQLIDQLVIGSDGAVLSFDNLPVRMADVLRHARRSRIMPAGETETDIQLPISRPVDRRRATPAREDLLASLEEQEYNVSAVARLYGRDRKQVYRWIKKYGIELPALD